MKSKSILMGAVMALGAAWTAAYADDGLDEVTMEMVFDDVDEAGAAVLTLREDELERDAHTDARSETRSGEGDRSDRGSRDELGEDGRVAGLADGDLDFDHDREEQREGDLEDRDVEEPAEGMDEAHDGGLEDGDGLEEAMGDDVAAESDLVDEALEDEVSEEDGEAV